MKHLNVNKTNLSVYRLSHYFYHIQNWFENTNIYGFCVRKTYF